MNRALAVTTFVAGLAASTATACVVTRLSLGDDGPSEGGADGAVALEGGPDVDPGEAGDAAPLPPPPPCVHGSPFLATRLVAGLEGAAVFSARFSRDEHEVYLAVQVPGPSGPTYDLFTTTRADRDARFGALVASPLSTPSDDYWPTVSADGLTTFYESNTNPDGTPRSGSIIWRASRASPGAPLVKGVLPYFSGNYTEGAPYLVGNRLYFASFGRPGSRNLDLRWVELDGERIVREGILPAGVNTDDLDEHYPVVTEDELEIFFSRTTADLSDDVYSAGRTGVGAPFSGGLVPVGGSAALNTPVIEWPSWVSPDACRLYFVRVTPLDGGGLSSTLWVAERARP